MAKAQTTYNKPRLINLNHFHVGYWSLSRSFVLNVMSHWFVFRWIVYISKPFLRHITTNKNIKTYNLTSGRYKLWLFKADILVVNLKFRTIYYFDYESNRVYLRRHLRSQPSRQHFSCPEQLRSSLHSWSLLAGHSPAGGKDGHASSGSGPETADFKCR